MFIIILRHQHKGVVQFRTFKDPFSATRDFRHNLSYCGIYLVLGDFVGPRMMRIYEYTVPIRLSLSVFRGSSDVVDENAVPMTNFSAARDMAIPSPGPSHTLLRWNA